MYDMHVINQIFYWFHIIHVEAIGKKTQDTSKELRKKIVEDLTHK